MDLEIFVRHWRRHLGSTVNDDGVFGFLEELLPEAKNFLFCLLTEGFHKCDDDITD